MDVTLRVDERVPLIDRSARPIEGHHGELDQPIGVVQASRLDVDHGEAVRVGHDGAQHGSPSQVSAAAHRATDSGGRSRVCGQIVRMSASNVVPSRECAGQRVDGDLFPGAHSARGVPLGSQGRPAPGVARAGGRRPISCWCPITPTRRAARQGGGPLRRWRPRGAVAPLLPALDLVPPGRLGGHHPLVEDGA